ncbi:MAG: transglutaminaseTgpA domain-containing protein, partial [Halobacteriaceae archaeon]
MAVAPAPSFLVSYLAFRGRFVVAAFVGSMTLGFFVLTSDAGSVATFLGVVGAVGATAFDTLRRHGGSRRSGEVLAATIALMILASTAVSAVGVGQSPVIPSGKTAVQGSLVSAGDRAPIYGSLRLSPKVRFIVEAEQAAYWKVGVYDRFTGRSWIRTGTSRVVSDSLDAAAPGPREPLYQHVIARQPLNVLPAASSVTSVSGLAIKRYEHGTIVPAETINDNESYIVRSEVLTASASQLRFAPADYPESLADTYTEVPRSTSPRVRQLAQQITQNATSAYGKVKAIERWLEANKRYSLSVERPSGNIVNSFLLQMNKGYCVYFASSMVVMLRTLDIP